MRLFFTLLFGVFAFGVSLKSTFLSGNKVVAKSYIIYKLNIENLFNDSNLSDKNISDENISGINRFILNSLEIYFKKKVDKNSTLLTKKTSFIDSLLKISDVNLTPFEEKRTSLKEFRAVLGTLKTKKEGNFSILIGASGLEEANNSRDGNLSLNILYNLQKVYFNQLKELNKIQFAKHSGVLIVNTKTGAVLTAVSDSNLSFFNNMFFTSSRIMALPHNFSKASEINETTKSGYLNFLQFTRAVLPLYDGGVDINLRFFKNTPIEVTNLRYPQSDKLKDIYEGRLEDNDKVKLFVIKDKNALRVYFFVYDKKLFTREKPIRVFAKKDINCTYPQIEGSKNDKKVNKLLASFPKADSVDYRILFLNKNYLSVVYRIVKDDKLYFLGKNIDLKEGNYITLARVLNACKIQKIFNYLNSYEYKTPISFISLNNFAFSENNFYFFENIKMNDGFRTGEEMVKIPTQLDIRLIPNTD